MTIADIGVILAHAVSTPAYGVTRFGSERPAPAGKSSINKKDQHAEQRRNDATN